MISGGYHKKKRFKMMQGFMYSKAFGHRQALPMPLGLWTWRVLSILLDDLGGYHRGS